MNKIAFLILFFILILANNLQFLMAQEKVEENIPILNLLSESGKLIPDIESNSILIIDYPSNIDMVEKYLKMADSQSEQVLIEARVVEVKLEKEHSLGVNWTLFAGKGGAELGQVRLGSASGSGLQQQIPFRQPTWEPLNIGGTAQSPFTMGIFDENIDIVLKALTTQLETEILSAPKITTTNNRRAKIDVVKTTPFLEEVEKEEEDITGGGTRTTFTYKYSYADEGVSLVVTPLINPDSSITIDIFPQVKEIVAWREVVAPEGAAGTPQLPETDVRLSQTKVTVREGQTIVIGGLIRNKVTNGTTKVPFLGDIPFLGSLFRSNKETKDKTELLILVSPIIITPKVLARMEREESLGIGKWYMQKREADKSFFVPSEDKEASSLIDSLETEVQDLIKERKFLEKKIYKEKEKLESISVQ